jgi:hypothetical protein
MNTIQNMQNIYIYIYIYATHTNWEQDERCDRSGLTGVTIWKESTIQRSKCDSMLLYILSVAIHLYITDWTTDNAHNETKTRPGSDHKDDLTAQHICRSVKLRHWEHEDRKSLNDDGLCSNTIFNAKLRIQEPRKHSCIWLGMDWTIRGFNQYTGKRSSSQKHLDQFWDPATLLCSGYLGFFVGSKVAWGWRWPLTSIYGSG